MKVKRHLHKSSDVVKQENLQNFYRQKTEKMKAYIEKPNRKVHRDAVDRMRQGLNHKHCNDVNEASALKKPLTMWVFS